MSDTPRTDVEIVKSCHENDGAFLAEDMMFFARELEREIATLETRHYAVMLHTQDVIDANAKLRECGKALRDALAFECDKLGDVPREIDEWDALVSSLPNA